MCEQLSEWSNNRVCSDEFSEWSSTRTLFNKWFSELVSEWSSEQSN